MDLDLRLMLGAFVLALVISAGTLSAAGFPAMAARGHAPMVRMGFGPGRGMGSMNASHNITSPNATQAQQFRQAVLAGDFATASALHDTYGLGGPIFGKLNSTTFPTYSRLANLRAESANLTRRLGSELFPALNRSGMNRSATGAPAPGRRMAMGGFGFGMPLRLLGAPFMGAFGPMPRAFAAGIPFGRHRLSDLSNSSYTP